MAIQAALASSMANTIDFCQTNRREAKKKSCVECDSNRCSTLEESVKISVKKCVSIISQGGMNRLKKDLVKISGIQHVNYFQHLCCCFTVCAVLCTYVCVCVRKCVLKAGLRGMKF